MDRYLARTFLRIFFASLIWATALFAIVEFFDRIATFLETGASLGTALRYFLFKIPLSVSRVIGFATLFSTLFCLGLLARNHEITAMRASGLTVQRIALPLVVLSLGICLVTFAWNEAVVPVFTQRAQTIYKTEVKSQKPQSLFGTRDIWIRGEGNFINVDQYDIKAGTLEGIKIFQLSRDFTLKGMIEIPSAEWRDGKWQAHAATQWNFMPDGSLAKQAVTVAPPISETPDDLKLLAREPEEFTFFDLQKQIADMQAKGIDATAYQVDLQVKLALPFIAPLVVLIAVPFALKRRVSGGLALSFGIAMLIAFAYWVLSAFCFSLGYSSALSPVVAAWAPNAIFALIGLYLFTAET
ncbi:MAG TPA: LPS export ABC transporter permease LptG [Candidatus Eisenbacteria bacterium]|nr:LPS export ABC transporter permease LptG [Candidatus Eisenbacteria bacterium]